MAAINTGARDAGDPKRRGLLSLFSRKAKSSTGESSLSSGSAGERSVSPARSDVSEGGGGGGGGGGGAGGGGSNSSLPPPPHQRPSSMPPPSTSSSSSTLTPSSFSTSTSAAPPPPRLRKRQAPAPPPSGETNGKESLRMDHGGDEGGEGGGRAPVSLSRCSSSSSGYQEAIRSPQTSPAESEVSEVTQRPHHHHITTTTSTNLTSTSSSSSLSLASRGKRRAPPPPKPLPAPPQPIPEEGEAPPAATPATSTPAKATEVSKQESEASYGSEVDSRPQSPPSPLPPVPPSPSPSSSSSGSSSLSYEEEKVTSTTTTAAASTAPPPDADAPPPPPPPSTLPSSSSSSSSTSTQPSELNLHQYLHHHSTTTNLLHHHSSTNHHPPPPQHPSSTNTTSSRDGGQMEEFKWREGASSPPLQHHHHQVSTTTVSSTNRVAGSGGGGGRGGKTSPEIPQKDARIPQDASRLPEITMDLQQIPQKDVRLPQDLQETPQDTSKLNKNLQKISRELQEMPQDPQIMPHVAHRKRKEAPRVPQETLPGSQNAPTVMPRSHVSAGRQADRRVGETKRMINNGNIREMDGNGKNRENNRTAQNSHYSDRKVDRMSRSNSSSNNSVSSISSSDSRRGIPTFRMVTQTQTKMNAKKTHTKTHSAEARMFVADGVTHRVQEGESVSASASGGGSMRGLAAKILGKNAGKSSGSLGKMSMNADRNSGSLGKMSKNADRNSGSLGKLSNNADRNSGSFGKMSKNADMNSESLRKIFGSSEGSLRGWQKPTGEAGDPRGSDQSDESDLEFNEDMFEPRYLLEGNLSPRDPLDLTPKTSTPDQRGAGRHPQPLKPLLPPTSPLSPASPPQPPPRGMAHRKRAPMPPPESEKAGISATAKRDQYPVSPAPPSTPTEEEEEKRRQKRLKEVQEGLVEEEQYLSHFSRLCEIDAELLSLLSEEGVDSSPPSLSRHPSSVSSTHDTLTQGQEGAALPQRESPDNVTLPRGQTIQTVPQDKISQIGQQRASPEVMTLISDQKTNTVPQKTAPDAMSHPKAIPPTSAVPAQSSASSYRAGYLAMLAELHADDGTVGIETKSTKNTRESTENIRGSTENSLGYTENTPKSAENTPGCYKAVTQDTGIVTSSRSGVKVPKGGESVDVRKRTHHHHQSTTISTTSSTTSLLSDSDHEVQTHRASFSSETSDDEEENSDHGDGDAHSSDDSSSGPPSPPLKHKIQHPLLAKPSQGDGDAHSSDESPPPSPPQLQKPKTQEKFPQKSKNAQNSADCRENGVDETWGLLPGSRDVNSSNRESGNTDKVHSQVIPEVLTARLRKKEEEEEEEEGKIGGTRDRSPSCCSSSSSSSASSSSESSKEEEEDEEHPSLSWDYPLPDPPTPFQDHPSPPSARDSASEGASSTKDTHSAGSVKGERTTTPPLKLPSLPEDQQRRRRRRRRRDSSSSSSVSAASSSSSEGQGEGGEEERKRNMINELRTAIREPRPEPRIVALKPKATVVYESRPAAPTHTPAAAPAPSAVPPTRLKASHKRDESSTTYESCEDAHSLRRSRSSSATSFDSAPPPLPDTPVPPATSSGGAGRGAASYKPPVVSFSISTYKSRAEETSYDKKVVKTDSSAPATLTTPSAAPTTTSTPPVTTAATTKPVLPEKPFFKEFSAGSRFSHAPPRWVPKPSEGERRATPFRYPAAPRRIQRGVNQLGRTASLGNLSVLERNLRRAQSTHDLYAGDSNTAPGDMQGVGNGNTAAPGAGGGNFGGGGGMPFFPMGGGGMVGEAGLADEFMKLQQDFFKWQQQLLQNQHVLHSRVAPLANNPPQLQSVGVIRDILGQAPPNGTPQEVAEARNPSVGMGGAGGRRQPVERIINIRFEDVPSETSESELYGSTFSRTGPVPDMTRDMAQMTTGPKPQQQQQPTRRWEEPSVSVGAWRDRPATQPSQDTSTYPPMPSPTPITPQPLSQPVSQPMSQQRMSPRPQGPRGYSRPADDTENSTRAYQWPPAASSSDLPAPPQQFQSLPPEQKQQFAQFIQQQQQQPTWPPKQHEQQQHFTQQPYQQQPLQQQYQPPLQQPYQQQPLQQQYQPPLQQPQQPPQLQPQQATWPPKQPSPQPQQQQQPLQQQPQQATWPPKQPSPQPQQQPQQQQPSQLQPQQATWPPKQPSPQPQQQQQPDRAAFWQELESKRQGLGLGQEEEEGEPARPARRGSRQDSPTQYYYNGDTTQAAAGGDGPRYTSVVTVASDSPEAAARDKVRSVVQLSTEQPPQQPRPAPVVRGFRQPGDEPGLQSRLLGSAAPGRARSSASPPAATNGLEAPAAARLVAAASATPPQRASPPRASPPQSFPGVQLRPVPSRASPPSEAIQPPATAAAPPPPPAPPMAPPPPPAPTMPQGERRTATGKKIISPKTGAELDAREELMMAIRGHGGMKSLRRTHLPPPQ